MAKIDRVAEPPSRLALPERFRNAGQTYGAIAALVLLILYNALFTPNFLTAQTLNVNLTQVATIVIVATGMTLVIATGGIDLSVGSLMAIAGALAPIIFLGKIVPLPPLLGNVLAVIVPILVAGLFGLFNGFLITTFRIQPIIATLVLFIATTFGRYVLATGGNESAARLAGVQVNRVKRTVYVVSGLLSGLAGLIVIAINSSSDANLVGLNMELNAIAATAVGGTPLTGGRATIVGTLLGALIIQLIGFTLLAKGVPYAVAQVVNAAIILIAVYIQRQRQG